MMTEFMDDARMSAVSKQRIPTYFHSHFSLESSSIITLFITLSSSSSTELLEQAYTRIRLNNPSLRVAILQSKQKPSQHDVDVLIASVATLGRSGSAHLSQLDPSLFKCIIIDEAHHATAATYLRVLDHFKAREKVSLLNRTSSFCTVPS